MSMSLPQLRVGEPLRHESLSVFPLFAETNATVDYRLADEALADESLLIEEVNQGGSVPELLVENKGDVRVLFLEGQELVGAKQNRVLNTSVLVAAGTRIKIPVSCVEQRRWSYRSKRFGESGSHSPSKLRRLLKSSVSRSLKAEGGYRSDQGEVWKEVDNLHKAHGVQSKTKAMSDAFDAHKERIDAYRENVKYVDGCIGVAVAIRDRVQSVDIFDNPATCQKIWGRLLSGAFLDAIESGNADQLASVDDVARLLADAQQLPWEQSPAVGEGQEYRTQLPQGQHASALSFEDTVVHGSVVAAV